MLVARNRRRPEEQHFTEGEPDLEPPEELAVFELEEEAILEEELDNEDVLEQDVDDDALAATLEGLVHWDDDEAADGADDAGVGRREPREFVCRGCLLVRDRRLLADPGGPLCADCAS